MTPVSAKEKISLGEIRSAYGDILRAYNEVYPLHPQTRQSFDDGTGDLDKGGEGDLAITFRLKAKKILPRPKEAADRSGNVKVWRRGDPLEGLSPGMEERIEKALKLGI